MREVDIFQMALGLTPPWEVSSCEFSAEKNAWTFAWLSPGAASLPARNAVEPASKPTTPQKRPGVI